LVRDEDFWELKAIVDEEVMELQDKINMLHDVLMRLIAMLRERKVLKEGDYNKLLSGLREIAVFVEVKK